MEAPESGRALPAQLSPLRSAQARKVVSGRSPNTTALPLHAKAQQPRARRDGKEESQFECQVSFWEQRRWRRGL